MVLPEGSLHVCEPHQVWPLRSECCGKGVPTNEMCAECMNMWCLGGKNSVVKGLSQLCIILYIYDAIDYTLLGIAQYGCRVSV